MKVFLLLRVSQLKRCSVVFDKGEKVTVTKKIISDRNEITESTNDIETEYALTEDLLRLHSAVSNETTFLFKHS